MKAIVKIPHISWRDGRPRFNPGPALRRLGYVGEDLRHASGAWFTLRETEDWAKRRDAEIAARRDGGGRRAPVARAGAYTIEDMFEDLWRSKRFELKAEKTRRDYRGKAAALAKFMPELFGVPAHDMTPAAVHALHERLWAAKGLPMANGVLRVLSVAYSAAIMRRPGLSNPCLRQGLPTPKPRVRAATPEEIAALMRAADAAEPEIGDAIMLALFTGQREGDVLALEEGAMDDGRVQLRQRKTGRVVSVRALPQLVARLAAIRERKRAANVASRVVILHPRTRAPYKADNFRARFALVREAAARDCPGLADFRFADLRDTAVTWLKGAGCNTLEIASVTGHSPKSVDTVLRHYMALDEDDNDRAMAKLARKLEGEG